MTYILGKALRASSFLHTGRAALLLSLFFSQVIVSVYWFHVSPAMGLMAANFALVALHGRERYSCFLLDHCYYVHYASTFVIFYMCDKIMTEWYFFLLSLLGVLVLGIRDVGVLRYVGLCLQLMYVVTLAALGLWLLSLCFVVEAAVNLYKIADLRRSEDF